MTAQHWLETQRQQAVQAIEPLLGQTACSQCITLVNGERYILRQQSQRASDYGICYPQEAALLRLLAPLQLAPVPLYHDSQSVLLPWLEGQTPTAFSDKLLIQLAQQLARLHQFVPTGDLAAVEKAFPFATFDLAERCQFLWDRLSQAQRQSLPFRPPFRRITPFSTAFCHHDIHLGNLIEQGERLWLIDWEYGGRSDPALDLALLLHANALTAQQQAVFFAAYFAKNTQSATACRAKITEYLPEVGKLTQLWYALQANIRDDNHSYL